MSIVTGRILWDTVFNKAGWTYATNWTDVAGFDGVHAMDWVDFTIARLPAGSDRRLTATNAAGTSFAVNTAALYYRPFSGMTVTVNVKSHSGTTLATLALDGTKAFAWLSFADHNVLNGQTVYLQFVVTGGSFDLRQAFLGPVLAYSVAANSPQAGVSKNPRPPIFQGAAQPRNNLSVNGSFLGRNIRAQNRTGTIEIDYVLPAWIRATWEPFVTHATSKTWFYAWDYDNYPTEVVFCGASEIIPPESTGPKYWSVQIPYLALNK